MTTAVLFILGCLLCGWATLRCMGNERELRVRGLEDRLRAEQQCGGPDRRLGREPPAADRPGPEQDRRRRRFGHPPAIRSYPTPSDLPAAPRRPRRPPAAGAVPASFAPPVSLFVDRKWAGSLHSRNLGDEPGLRGLCVRVRNRCVPARLRRGHRGTAQAHEFLGVVDGRGGPVSRADRDRHLPAPRPASDWAMLAAGCARRGRDDAPLWRPCARGRRPPAGPTRTSTPGSTRSPTGSAR